MKFGEIINATLNKNHTISIHIHKSYTQVYTKHFYLYCDDVRICELNIMDQRETGNHFHYELNNVPALSIGHEYKIYDDRYMYTYLNTNVLLKHDKMCNIFYSDEVMGAHYHKYYTTFRVFSPLASCAFVVFKKDGIESIVSLEKNSDTGVFFGRVQGDLAKATYYFMVRINGELISSNDPYCYGLTSQSSRGVIVDPSAVKVDLKEECLPPFNNITDAVIYEISVRDMTSMKGTSIRHKGKFLGLTETSCKSLNANPIGIDYIKSLGVTHVQIMPMADFCTVNDENPKEAYNWGYDPLYYNTPEGSYCTDPKDPYSRIIEMKKMIACFHKAGIRVVMDVVYNHLFSLDNSAFEKLCPSYYFRYKEDGTPSNGSFCGNEFNSSRPMARKFIIDSCLYWVKNYGIDGFRFDLMGLLDLETINLIQEECQKIKPGFICYGEGWDMPSVLNSDMKAKMQNAEKMPKIGFFNDRYRDIVKGKSGDYDLAVKGYLLGDINYIDGFKHCYLGSCIALAHPPLFNNASQSINYVECHDNATVYDKLKVSNGYESEENLLKRIKIINAVNILAFGVPFIHAGQEMGCTKHGHHNSYNAGDDINHFDYDLMDNRMDLINHLKGMIKFRKKYDFFKNSDREVIKNMMEFTNLDYGALLITYKLDNFDEFKRMYVIINPNCFAFKYDFNQDVNILVDENGLLKSPRKTKQIEIKPISLTIYTA